MATHRCIDVNDLLMTLLAQQNVHSLSLSALKLHNDYLTVFISSSSLIIHYRLSSSHAGTSIYGKFCLLLSNKYLHVS